MEEISEFDPARSKFFLLSTSFRTALRPTQPPLQRVQGDIPPGVKRPES
jgi:hypothetical protein